MESEDGSTSKLFIDRHAPGHPLDWNDRVPGDRKNAVADEAPGHSLHRLGEVLGSEHIQEVVSVFGIANTLSGEWGRDFSTAFSVGNGRNGSSRRLFGYYFGMFRNKRVAGSVLGPYMIGQHLFSPVSGQKQPGRPNLFALLWTRPEVNIIYIYIQRERGGERELGPYLIGQLPL